MRKRITAFAVVDVSEDLGHEEHTHAHVAAEDCGVCRCDAETSAVVSAAACATCWAVQVVPFLHHPEFSTPYVLDTAAWVFARDNGTEFCATLAVDGNPTNVASDERTKTSSESWIKAISKMTPKERGQITVLYVHTGYWCSRKVAHVSIGDDANRAVFLRDVARALPAAKTVYLVID